MQLYIWTLRNFQVSFNEQQIFFLPINNITKL